VNYGFVSKPAHARRAIELVCSRFFPRATVVAGLRSKQNQPAASGARSLSLSLAQGAKRGRFFGRRSKKAEGAAEAEPKTLAFTFSSDRLDHAR
jgi:hypothetical protein